MQFKRLLTILTGVLLLSATAAFAQEQGETGESSAEPLSYQGFTLGSSYSEVESQLEESEADYESDSANDETMQQLSLSQSFDLGEESVDGQLQLVFYEGELFSISAGKELETTPDEIKSLQDNWFNQLSSELGFSADDVEPQEMNRQGQNVRMYNPEVDDTHLVRVMANWLSGEQDQVEGDNVRGLVSIQLSDRETSMEVQAEMRRQAQQRQQQQGGGQGGPGPGGSR